MTHILIFGDSISYGAYDKEGGWVQRLRKFTDEKYLASQDIYSFVYNVSISGNDTNNLIERFESEAIRRVEEEEENILIFAIGINDSFFIHSKNGFKVDQDKFKENIEKLIELAREYSSKIIFVGPTPVEEAKTTPIPWDTDKSYKNENIRKYDEIIKSICEEKKVYFIEVFNTLSKLDYNALLEDGAHPNSEGHKKIFEIVRDFLVENKII